MAFHQFSVDGMLPGTQSFPLTGIKVLELEGIGPGPLGCCMLADFGAEVTLSAPVDIPTWQPIISVENTNNLLENTDGNTDGVLHQCSFGAATITQNVPPSSPFAVSTLWLQCVALTLWSTPPFLQVITVVRASKGKARSQNDPVSRGKVGGGLQGLTCVHCTHRSLGHSVGPV